MTPVPADRQPIVEDVEESLLEGDDYPTYRRGTARAAFAHRDFRLMWLGSFGSNIGTWMQQVVLGAYAYRLTGSSSFVAALAFAQLGPLLVLSIPGGVLADAVDRRRLLVSLQCVQGLFSLLLAVLVWSYATPPGVGLFLCVLVIGVANAINAPTWATVLPALVGREDLSGAISLNSTMINGSRVIGPAIGGVLYPIIGAGWIFAINALTYLFVIVALLSIRFPFIAKASEKGWARLMGGFREARSNPVVGRILVLLALFSFFCLPFVGLFAPIAEIDLSMETKSFAYGLLYACFGLGAAAGSLSIGTVFAGRDKKVMVRLGLLVFAAALFTFGVLRSPAPAYPVVFVLGAVYFGTTTSMLTVLQSELDDRVRGRVMSLWFMAFGGTIAVGALAFGPLLDASNGTVVLTIGALAALGLAAGANLTALAKRGLARAAA
jgi:MFS family permease